MKKKNNTHIILAIFTFFLVLTIYLITILGHLGMQTVVGDHALFAQFIGNISSFRGLGSSIRGVDNLWLDHQHFSLVLLIPFWWIFNMVGVDSAVFLILITPILTVVLPIVLLWHSYKYLTDSRGGLLLFMIISIVLSMHPLAVNGYMFYFHEVTLLPTLYSLLFFFFSKWLYKVRINEDNDRSFLGVLIAFILILLTKEDQLFYLFFFTIQLAVFGFLYLKKYRINTGGNILDGLRVLLWLLFVSIFYLLVLLLISQFREVHYSMGYNINNPFLLDQFWGYIVIDIPTYLMGNISGLASTLFRLGMPDTQNPMFHHGLFTPTFSVITLIAVSSLLNFRLRDTFDLCVAILTLVPLVYVYTFESDRSRVGMQAFYITKYLDFSRKEGVEFGDAVNFIYANNLNSIESTYRMLPHITRVSELYINTGMPEEADFGKNSRWGESKFNMVKYAFLPKKGSLNCNVLDLKDCDRYGEYVKGKEVLYENKYYIIVIN